MCHGRPCWGAAGDRGWGAGKTRLALRLGEELTAAGWRPLWVPRGSEHEAVAAAREVGQPYVLVVDYAETRSDLVGLLNDAAADRDGPDLRVLLLARSAGEWWQHLAASAEERAAVLLEASLPLPLGPVRAAGGPQEVFADALAAFASRLGVARPDVTLALAERDPVVLVVHAAALLAVIDHATGARPPQEAPSGPRVLEALLGHESRASHKGARLTTARAVTVSAWARQAVRQVNRAFTWNLGNSTPRCRSPVFASTHTLARRSVTCLRTARAAE